MGILHAGRVQNGHRDRFRCRRGKHRGKRPCRGRLIHHAAGPATPVVPIAVPVIGTSFRTLLVATTSGAQALVPRLAATVQAAVALASVASTAKKEHLPAQGTDHDPKRLHVLPLDRVKLRWTCSSSREKTDSAECRSTRHPGGLGGPISGLPPTPSRIGRRLLYLTFTPQVTVRWARLEQRGVMWRPHGGARRKDWDCGRIGTFRSSVLHRRLKGGSVRRVASISAVFDACLHPSAAFRARCLPCAVARM